MDDLIELEKMLKRIEKFPTAKLTKAVKRAAAPMLLQTQVAAPIGETGNLVKALIMNMEKGKPGKRIAQITYDKAYNDKLAKISLTGKRSYYPASQEYGYKLRNGKKKAGQYFMRRTADKNDAIFKANVVTYMMDDIEKMWRK
jgi:hypothetical protein